MPGIQNKKCFNHSDGAPGFIAKGNVPLRCSDSCGEDGKAELWCVKCCPRNTTWFDYPTNKGGLTLFRTTPYAPRYNDTDFGSRWMTPAVAVGISVGGILLLIMIILAVYCIRKFQKKKGTEESVNAGEREPVMSHPVNDDDHTQRPVLEGQVLYMRSLSSEGS